jgi:hypothetical protein
MPPLLFMCIDHLLFYYSFRQNKLPNQTGHFSYTSSSSSSFSMLNSHAHTQRVVVLLHVIGGRKTTRRRSVTYLFVFGGGKEAIHTQTPACFEFKQEHIQFFIKEQESSIFYQEKSRRFQIQEKTKDAAMCLLLPCRHPTSKLHTLFVLCARERLCCCLCFCLCMCKKIPQDTALPPACARACHVPLDEELRITYCLFRMFSIIVTGPIQVRECARARIPTNVEDSRYTLLFIYCGFH